MDYGTKNYLSSGAESGASSYGSGNYLGNAGNFEAQNYGTLGGSETSAATKGGGMDPYSAAIMVAGTFLTNMMGQKAKEEEMKKQTALQAVNTGLQQENVGNNTLMQAWAKGLGGMK